MPIQETLAVPEKPHDVVVSKIIEASHSSLCDSMASCYFLA